MYIIFIFIYIYICIYIYIYDIHIEVCLGIVSAKFYTKHPTKISNTGDFSKVSSAFILYSEIE